MKRTSLSLLILLSCLLTALAPAFPRPAAAAAAAPVHQRQRQRMDSGWKFQISTASTSAHSQAVTGWRWRLGTEAEAAAMLAPALDTSTGDWKESVRGEDVFAGKPGFAWYRLTLPALPFPKRILHFESVDDNATVYLNGTKLVAHQGWNDPFDVPLDAAWKADGPNVVVVLVENSYGGGGIAGPVTLGTQVTSDKPVGLTYNDRSWRTVHLPHDYVVEGTFDPNGDVSHAALPTPRAWYRKTFTLPAADKGKSVWIDFDGVYRDSIVYLNGQMLGEHPGGYDSFRYDIGAAAHFGGSNVLAVSVNPTHHEGWWYEGGGIYRHVWLNVAAPVHIAPWGVFVTTKLPEPGADSKAAAATVTIKTAINAPVYVHVKGPQTAYRLVTQVLDPTGTVNATTITPLGVPDGSKQVTQKVTVARPVLWSLESPRLYRLHTVLQAGGKAIDATDTPFGIRTLRFDAQKGFFLNGKSVKIKGTCNHQDFAGVGTGMPDSLLVWRIKKLKSMGSNAVRMSHNPPAAEMLDACDKLGMLVMDESRHLGDTEEPKSSPTTPYSDLSELKSMLRRDRNHPSIIMWSMCNEEPQEGTAAGHALFAAMKKVTDAFDGTRPVTSAMDGGYFSAAGISSAEDLQGINYHSWDYDTFHKAHPEMPLYGSETSSEVGTRGVYGPDKFVIDKIEYLGDQAKGHISAYDLHAPGWAETAETAWGRIADRPFVAGGYVWTGFDYKGEPTPFYWPDINSNFGILDQCGFPKDLYYYYRSVWGSTPIVHVFPHWNWAGQEGKPIDVWAFSNAARVELFLNGKSLGVEPMPKNGHVHWSVPYTPGTLEARGYGADGQVIATDHVETTGAPAGLKLTTDRKTLTADGEDVTMVEVDVVDARGRVVPTADTQVTFAVSGAGHVAGVGNGDPSCHEPDQAKQRSAFHGKCLVVVGAGEAPGSLRLTATAPGLKPATLTLAAQ